MTGWRRHVGEIRVVVAPSFQKSRLATTPIHELVNHATMLHLFGMDHLKLTYRFQGRDFRLTDVHGRVVQDILA